MKLTTPPKIKWLTQGSVQETTKKLLTKEAHRQIKALLRSLQFQDLQQGTTQKQIGNYVFQSSSVMGINTVNIKMKVEDGAIKDIAKFCWCGCQITFGTIIDKIVCSPFGTGCAPGDFPYPACAISDIGTFSGLRYQVKLCQYKKWTVFCCSATDFEEYEIEDLVALLFIDFTEASLWDWDLQTCGKFACKGTIRDKELDTVTDGIDGQFVILPYTFL